MIRVSIVVEAVDASDAETVLVDVIAKKIGEGYVLGQERGGDGYYRFDVQEMPG